MKVSRIWGVKKAQSVRDKEVKPIQCTVIVPWKNWKQPAKIYPAFFLCKVNWESKKALFYETPLWIKQNYTLSTF